MKLKKIILYLLVVVVVLPLINSVMILDLVVGAQTTGVSPAKIIVNLDPSVDNAVITAERVSTLAIDGTEIPSPDGENINLYETNDSVGGEYTIENIEMYCGGSLAWSPTAEWSQFTVSAEVEGREYTPERVTLGCNVTEEITLSGEDDDTAGLVRIFLNFHNCTADDELQPVPSRTGVEVEGEEGTERPTGDRLSDNENHRVFIFRDLAPGEYTWRAAFQQRISPGDPTDGSGYEYRGEGEFTVQDEAVRIVATLNGDILTPESPETEHCGRPDDEEPPVDDSNKICEQEIKVTGGWLICLIIDAVDSLADGWIGKVEELLSVGGDEYNTAQLRRTWSYFRNIASLLLMVIGLVMIIGQGISKE